MQVKAQGVGTIGRRRVMWIAAAAGLSAAAGLLPRLERAVGTLREAPAAVDALAAAIDDYLSAEQTLTIGHEEWRLPRRDVGLAVTPLPEDWNPLRWLWGAVPTTPPVAATIDPAALARHLPDLPGLDRPAVDATLRWDGGVVTLTPERPGRRVDLNSLAARLVDQAHGLDDSPLAVPTIEIPAAVTAADLEQSAAWLRRALARPLTVGEGATSLTPSSRPSSPPRSRSMGRARASWTAIVGRSCSRPSRSASRPPRPSLSSASRRAAPVSRPRGRGHSSTPPPLSAPSSGRSMPARAPCSQCSWPSPPAGVTPISHRPSAPWSGWWPAHRCWRPTVSKSPSPPATSTGCRA
jgi:hypothetical protein